MIKCLRLKFIGINMAIVLLMLCLIFGTVLHITRVSTERESIRMMQAEAMAPVHVRRPGEPLRRTRLPCFTLRVTPEGELLSEGDRFYDLTDEALLWELYNRAAAETETAGVFVEDRLRYCRMDSPMGVCIVFADISGELAARRSLLQTCLLIGAASTAVFLLISIVLSFWAVRPVEEAWQQQRQFVSDASHELKTPLTVILTNAELLRDSAENGSFNTQFSENILVMSQEMRGLIENLLELARADSGIVRQSMAALDLSRMVSRTLLPFEPIYFEKGLALAGEIAEGITVWGSEAHLKQVVEILLDNAQKYASPGGEVRVVLKKAGRNHGLLSVSNPGTALSPKERKDIFKRFYRADEARSRDGSYGLGLSIAQAVVQRHHGRIWAESADGRNSFCVLLPTLHRTAGGAGREKGRILQKLRKNGKNDK